MERKSLQKSAMKEDFSLFRRNNLNWWKYLLGLIIICIFLCSLLLLSVYQLLAAPILIPFVFWKMSFEVQYHHVFRNSEWGKGYLFQPQVSLNIDPSFLIWECLNLCCLHEAIHCQMSSAIDESGRQFEIMLMMLLYFNRGGKQMGNRSRKKHHWMGEMNRGTGGFIC